MRSACPRFCMPSPAVRCWRMCSRRRAKPARPRRRSWSVPIRMRSRPRPSSVAAGRAMLRAARAARHRACGAGGRAAIARGRRRHSHRLRRHAADPRRRRLKRLRAPLADGAAVAVLGFRAADPAGYGRLVVEGDELVAIREEADASAKRKRDRSVQRRHHGACRRAGARDPRAHRRRQSQSANSI